MTAKRNTPLTPKRRELDPLVHSPTAQAKRREPWLRFVAAVAHDFTEADLGLMAWSTVKGLVAHVGIVDPMDVALVQVHWQEHASRTEAKRALIAKQAREAAEERQREEDARVAAEEKAKRDREEAARLAAEAEVEAAQRKKLGLSTSRFSTSPRTSLGTRPSSLGVRRSASPTAVAPSASAAKSPAVATGGARKPSASPDSRAKAVSTPPSATQPPISSLTKVSTNVPSRVTPRPNSAVNGAASPKPTTPVTPSSARKVVVTEPAKQTTPRPAAAPVTALTSKASTSSAAPPVSSVASPPSPATRTRTAEAKAAAIFSKATAAPSPAAAPATNTGVTSPDPVAARTSVELDLFLATPDRREARSASPFSNPVLGDDGEPLSVDDVKSIFKEWCLYAHGTTDKAINFGRFMRWMKAIGIVDRHFLPRDAEVAFRSAMQQYHSIEAKRAANGASPADSPHRAPSVASLQSVATAAGDGAGERMPYHVFRMKLMPELASKLRCTVSDLVKRFHYCGGPKEASPKKRVDIYYSAATAPAAL